MMEGASPLSKRLVVSRGLPCHLYFIVNFINFIVEKINLKLELETSVNLSLLSMEIVRNTISKPKVFFIKTII